MKIKKYDDFVNEEINLKKVPAFVSASQVDKADEEDSKKSK